MSALARYVAWPPREERRARRRFRLPLPSPLRLPRLAGPAWPAWRRHRAAFRTMLALALLAGIGAVREHHQLVGAVHHYADLCRAADGCDLGGGDVAAPTVTHVAPYVLRYLPVAVGALVGAPLFAQELESGTHRLAWTQSVGRREWAAVRLGLAAAVTTLAAVVVTVPASWWWYSARRGHDGGPDRFAWRAVVWWNDWDFFAWTGPVGVAHLLLALTTGAATGLLVRRTLPAVAAAAGLGEAALFGLEKLRPHLLTPHIRRTRSLDFPSTPLDGWFQGFGYVRSDGTLTRRNPCSGPGLQDFSGCLARHHIVGRYNSSFTMDQFLPLQLVETGICLTATAALAAFCLWHVRRVKTR
ncbi:ABC transporter permease subunit [Actinacidiphila sp. bgisy144]|uniref:ABC transporter permease subunit n=1 Tax=Actinacidiphila sp. bgisy144 TaxID=3413791 RepID=UPI003EB99F54